MSTALDRLKQVFVTSLDLPPETDVPRLRYAEHEKWDSIAHLKLVAQLESEFDIMLDADEILALSSFEKAVEMLRQRSIEIP
jgi:acyl carrier protein